MSDDDNGGTDKDGDVLECNKSYCQTLGKQIHQEISI